MNDAAHAEQSAPAGSAGSGSSHPPLRRSRRHKVVGGVCGGLGRQWDLDPVIFRVVLAVLSVGGLGLIVYGFAWLLIPLDGEEENEARRLLSGRVEGSALTALLFALVGCGLFLTSLSKGSMMSFAIMVTLAVAGSAYWSRRRRIVEAEGPEAMDTATAQAVADAPPETKAPPVPTGPSWWRAQRSGESAGPGYLWGPDTTPLPLDLSYRTVHGADTTGAPAPHAARADADRLAGRSGPPDGATPAGAPRRSRREGRPIGGWTFLFALLAGAGTALAVSRHDGLTPALQAGLACTLLIFGLGLVLSAWYGRTGGGTVFMVVLMSLLLAGATTLPGNLTAQWQNQTWFPTTAAAVRPHYELGTGEGQLDLTGLPFKADRTVHTGVDVGAGLLRVTLPHGVTARLHLSLGLGDIQLPGEPPQDVDLVASRERTVDLPADGLKKGERPHGSVVLNLDLGAGQLAVERAAPGTTPATFTTSAAALPAADLPAADLPASDLPAPTAPATPTAPTPQGAPR
ncbi:PspC domain-containing protein [Streptomyces sp. NPDC058773]|uniref:PspC domain-containing protein n=1 Tax=Streptomyces sp. NPDC058773 TaxID=3346632 RepID=UPI00368C2E48